ncbi:hypothetical protein OJ253_3674, partial [Cryptosporidium canis]
VEQATVGASTLQVKHDDGKYGTRRTVVNKMIEDTASPTTTTCKFELCDYSLQRSCLYSDKNKQMLIRSRFMEPKVVFS